MNEQKYPNVRPFYSGYDYFDGACVTPEIREKHSQQSFDESWYGTMRSLLKVFHRDWMDDEQKREVESKVLELHGKALHKIAEDGIRLANKKNIIFENTKTSEEALEALFYVESIDEYKVVLNHGDEKIVAHPRDLSLWVGALRPKSK